MSQLQSVPDRFWKVNRIIHGGAQTQMFFHPGLEHVDDSHREHHYHHSIDEGF